VYQQLATYLQQYKQVSIPQVGSFELIPQPAILDVASKLILPPLYLPQYSNKDSVKEHQLNFLALDLNTDKDIVREQLENFGRELKTKIQGGALAWKGVGRLESEEAKMIFHPDVIEIRGLKPIAAEKVLRKNVQHTVLRGEQEVLSASFHDEEKKIGKKKSVGSLVGWIVVALSVVFIAVYLYSNGFKTTASGTKMKVRHDSSSATHK
jgi:hypothetical protein